MSFRNKVLLALIVAGVVPLLLLGVFSYRANRAQLQQTVGQLQLRAAHELARASRDYTFQALDDLNSAVRYLPLAQSEGSELGTILSIPFRQVRGLNLVAVLDQSGNSIAPPVYAVRQSPEHELMDEVAIATFSGQVPVRTALEVGTVIGQPYASGGSARLVLGVRVPDAQRALVAELSLREVQRRVTQLGEEDGLAFVVGPDGLLLAASRPGALSTEERAFVDRALRAEAPAVETLLGGNGEEYLAAFAPVPDLGWGVVVGRPSREAFAPAQKVRNFTLFWAVVALLVAAALGLVLTQSVAGPVRLLADAVKGMAAGRYQPVPVSGSDELAELASSFNVMSEEVRRRDAEIRGFNAELQQRVDQKTRELEAAQNQIERSRRLTALGSFSAGFTHELNNPLTSVLGLAALLDRQARGTPNAELTGPLLEQSRRIAKVVAELRRLSDEQVGSQGHSFPLQRVVNAAARDLASLAEERKVNVTIEAPDQPLPLLGRPADVQKVVENLMRNAITAMEGGGQLRVTVTAVGAEAVRLEVHDTGKGIAPDLQERVFDPFFGSKTEPGALGLGLSIANHIIEAHHGRLSLISALGKGSTFTVVFPAAPLQAHLY